VAGELQITCLAEEIDTPGPGQIKALIAIAGNPVLSLPTARVWSRRWTSWSSWSALTSTSTKLRATPT
jgi:anaerobic selenocysteine-containing dehydrogenase